MTARVSFHFGTVDTLFELASGLVLSLPCRYYDAHTRLAAKQRFLLGAFRRGLQRLHLRDTYRHHHASRGREPFSGAANCIAPSSVPQPNTVVPDACQPSNISSGSACLVRALISTHQSGQRRHPLEHGAGQQPAHQHDAGSDARRPFAWDRANYSAVPQRVDWRASHDLAPCTFGSIQGHIIPANPISLPASPPGVTGVFGAHVVAVDASGSLIAVSMGVVGVAPRRGLCSLWELRNRPFGRSYKVYAEPLGGAVAPSEVSNALVALCQNATTDPGWPPLQGCVVPNVDTAFTTRTRP